MKPEGKSNLLIRIPMLIGGIFTFIIGVGHIFLPSMGYDKSVPLSMEPEVSEHFYYLGTYAICSFLLALGAISIYFSRIKLSQQTVVISFILALVWIARAVFEFIYPVMLKIFMLDTPHSILKLVTSFIALLYVISTLFGWSLKKA